MVAARGSAESLLRVGVVGVGVMGSNHARVIAELPGVEFVGVADPDRPQANFVAETLGCAAMGDLDELIALERQGPCERIAVPTRYACERSSEQSLQQLTAIRTTSCNILPCRGRA